MRVLLAVLLLAVAFASAENYQEQTESEVTAVPEEELSSAFENLNTNAPKDISKHVENIKKHLKLLQRAKAFRHNFSSSQRAIRAAIKLMGAQLTAGHNHDVNALKRAKARLSHSVASVATKNKNKVAKFKAKACPTKRNEETNRKKRANALSTLRRHANTNICSSVRSMTLGHMDVDKRKPRMSSGLRRAWTRARSAWVRLSVTHRRAVNAHNLSIKRHRGAMQSFHTALKLEARNAHNTCRREHRDFATLKRAITGNIGARKQTFIAAKVIACFVDHVKSNTNAKRCAATAKRANTNLFNIRFPHLRPCTSTRALTSSFGPARWTPTTGNCGKHSGTPTERKHKAPERRNKERRSKERKNKERHHKHRERYTKERRSKEHRNKEGRGKERTRKERANKARERSHKERANKARERSHKARERSHKKRKAWPKKGICAPYKGKALSGFGRKGRPWWSCRGPRSYQYVVKGRGQGHHNTRKTYAQCKATCNGISSCRYFSVGRSGSDSYTSCMLYSSCAHPSTRGCDNTRDYPKYMSYKK